MGQITNPIVKGISVLPIDRQSGPAAGAGATGNNSLFLGAGAGLNSTASNLIILGHGSGGAGIPGPAFNGTIVLGVNSLTALTGASTHLLPLVVIGAGIADSMTNADSTVLIGNNILSDFTNAGVTESVLIGNAIFPLKDGTGAQKVIDVVAIGYSIGALAADFNSPQTSVLIGSNILPNMLGNGIQGCIFIGDRSGSGITTSVSDNIHIGISTTGSTGGSNNVIIGANSAQVGSAGGDQSNVMLGATCMTSGSFNTVLGSRAQTAPNNTNFGTVAIGANAGNSLPATATNILIIEASTALGGGTGNAPSALIFGQFGTGNLILGQSSTGVNRDFGGVPGTNMLKLLNGTKATGTTIIGGGYFYVSAGVLHWVDSNGVDFGLSDPAAPTTGASTASFVATNKPGATTGAGPIAWENRVINGVSYQSPLWAT
jgi:hypothetical protein